MLVELHIQNIAVIQKATIPFTEGFNVFTGETGAGKTMLLFALDAVLGERTSKDIIRTGEEKAKVSALFEDVSPATLDMMAEMGYEAPDKSVLIVREITQAGKNTCRVNGLPATVSVLKELSKHLVHIHGQRDTGQLLSSDNHLDLIDSFGELGDDLVEYQAQFDKLRSKQKELSNLDMDESQKEQRLDMLRFQIEEIELAQLEDPDEEDDLLARKKLVTGSERVREGLASAIGAYYGDGDIPGLEELHDIFLDGAEQTSQYIDDYNDIVEQIENLNNEYAELVSDMEASLEEMEFDPSELDTLERRLDTIYNLKRKYGSSIEEILEHYDAAVQELDNITFSDKKQERLQHEIENLTGICEDLAKKITRKRSIACKKFMTDVEKELAFLDMPNVKLSVAHAVVPLSRLGRDQLEFMIVANVGEEPKSLSKVASGGELARLMLAIKNVLADKDDIDTLVFDEIDAGVSGKAAGKIGRKLADVARTRQVICVTHLSQVAAFARNHLYIYKTVEENRTFTKVEQLDHKETIHELARITSGEMITEAALTSAEELWEYAHSK